MTDINPEPLQEAPADSPALQSGNWVTASRNDPITEFIEANLWPQTSPSPGWEFARRSAAVYVYRSAGSDWAVCAKFYRAKTGEAASRYARREFEFLEQARGLGLDAGALRVVKPLALWQGVLFLEYIDGLTLEDSIAVRRSRPGALYENLSRIAALFATLHAPSRPPSRFDDFSAAVRYGEKLVDNLSKYGVLQDEPTVSAGLRRLFQRWAAEKPMDDFTPTLTHGDATTTNFIFPWQNGQLVAVDWERAKVTDPAADIGRLLAEISHSVMQHGGNNSEASQLQDHFIDCYNQTLTARRNPGRIQDRARFYQAISSLRIARNGWLPRLERTALVAQAMALLV